MPPPKVTVIVNCFNGERFIASAIKNILRQTFGDFEIVVFDNFSSDRSGKICLGFTDSRVKYVRSPEHYTLYRARHEAIQEARGELIAFLDVDDCWDMRKLELQVQTFEDPNIYVSSTAYHVVRDGQISKMIAPPLFPAGFYGAEVLVNNYFVCLSSIMFRRSMYHRLGVKFSARYEIIGDFDFIITAANKMPHFFMGDILVEYHEHGSNLSRRKRLLRYLELEQWVSENLGLLGGLKGDLYRKLTDDIYYGKATSYSLENEWLKSLANFFMTRSIMLKLRYILFVIFNSKKIILRKQNM